MVLEIGPGLGSLTLALAEQGAEVVALEIDARLAGVLVSVLESAEVSEHVRVEVADACESDLEGCWRARARGRACRTCRTTSRCPW